jgi:hypothetical protein
MLASAELGKVGFAPEECQTGKRDRPLNQGWEARYAVRVLFYSGRSNRLELSPVVLFNHP